MGKKQIEPEKLELKTWIAYIDVIPATTFN